MFLRGGYDDKMNFCDILDNLQGKARQGKATYGLKSGNQVIRIRGAA